MATTPKTEPVDVTNNGAEPEPVDPFDTSALYDPSAVEGSLLVLTALPARSPRSHEFFRVNPDPAYQRIGLGLKVDINGSDETCWLAPNALDAALAAYARPFRMMVTTVLVHPDQVMLWPQKLPDEAGNRASSWHHSALKVIERAKAEWLRKIANRATNAYDIALPISDLGEPAWPAEPLSELMKLAFTGDQLVDSADHPVLRRLRGDL